MKKHLQLQDEASRLYRGPYQQALPLAKQALALAVEEFGPDSEQASIQTSGIGMIAEATGDYAEAARQYAESLRAQEIVFGRDNPLATHVLEGLGRALLKLNRLAEAEGYFSRALKIWRDMFGEDPALAGAYSGLGAVNLARGDFGAALASYRKAVYLLTTHSTEKGFAQPVIEDGSRSIATSLSASGAQPRHSASSRAPMSPGSWRQLCGRPARVGNLRLSALAKMTARLKAGETELGRAVRRLDTLNYRILELERQDKDAYMARFKIQQADPAARQAFDALRAAAVVTLKDPAIKRQREFGERLQALMKRCPAPNARGCEGSEREPTPFRKKWVRLPPRPPGTWTISPAWRTS